MEIGKNITLFDVKLLGMILEALKPVIPFELYTNVLYDSQNEFHNEYDRYWFNVSKTFGINYKVEYINDDYLIKGVIIMTSLEKDSMLIQQPFKIEKYKADKNLGYIYKTTVKDKDVSIIACKFTLLQEYSKKGIYNLNQYQVNEAGNRVMIKKKKGYI